MSQPKKLPEPARTILVMLTAAICFIWLAAVGYQLFPVDRQAWYSFPTQLTVMYVALGLAGLVGWFLWKLTERFK